MLNRSNRRPWPIIAWAAAASIPAVFLAVYFVGPVASLLYRGLFGGAALSTLEERSFTEVLLSSRTLSILEMTLGQALAGTVLSVVLGLPVAHVLYRVRWRGQGLVRGFITVPFVLPTVVVGIAFRTLIGEGGPLGFLGLDGSLTAIIAALVFFNFALIARMVGATWQRLDPRLEEAARTLGATPSRIFFTVTVPALAPVIASAASLVFLYCATAFGVVMVMGGTRYATVETEIWRLTTVELDLRAGAVLSVLQILIVSVSLAASTVARKKAETALALNVVEARPIRLLNGRRPGPDLAPVLATVVAVGGLLTAPLLSLLIRSFETGEGYGLANYYNLSTVATSILPVPITEAIANSLRTATYATAVAVGVGALLSFLVSRRPKGKIERTAISLLDGAYMLPLGISAVTLGFGYLISPSLRGSPLTIPLAQAVVAIPLVIRVLTPVLRAVDPRLRHAAATLGAGPLRAYLTVDMAELSRALGVAAGFAFAVSIGEFGATSFLARPDMPTLPVAIYWLISRPGAQTQGMAMAGAVILAALTATIMVIAEKMRPANAAGF